jgi:hypothetical protein
MGTKQNQDLPNELWIEILSYLPPHILSTKLLGIGSRYLFEAGMNELYEEVRVVSTSSDVSQSKSKSKLKQTCGGELELEKCLEQLKYESVRRRVKKVVIGAGFRLFRLGCGGEGDESGGAVEKDEDWGRKFKFRRWKGRRGKGLFGRAITCQEHGDRPLETNLPELLSLAIERLRITACPNLQEITIEALGENEPITPIYAHFLHSLLTHTPHSSSSSKPLIKILNIEVDIHNWRNKSDSYKPFSILPIGFSALKNLTKLNVSLETSIELSIGGGEYMSCIEQLREVVLEARETLESLAVRTSLNGVDLPCDVAEIFPVVLEDKMTFPALKKLKIESEVYGMNIVRSDALVKFLTLSTVNLESLTLFCGKGYGRGPEEESTLEQAKKQKLGDIMKEIMISGICLPTLQELVISLSAIEVDALMSVSVFEAGLFPCLRKLVLAPLEGYSLSFDVFKMVLEGIVVGGGAESLEDIEMYVRMLSPSHLEVLQNWFKKLKRVYLVYDYLCVVPDVPRFDEVSLLVVRLVYT